MSGGDAGTVLVASAAAGKEVSGEDDTTRRRCAYELADHAVALEHDALPLKHWCVSSCVKKWYGVEGALYDSSAAARSAGLADRS